MNRPSRVGLLAVATIASALLAAGPAVAQDKPPVVGTTECTEAVNKDPAVQKAPDETAKDAARADATARVCVEGTSDAPESPTPDSTPEEQSPGPDAESNAKPSGDALAANRRVVPGNDAPTPKRAGRPAGDRDCADFATQQQAQRYFESIGGSATNNADRLDANGNGVACESLADDGDNQDAEATATGDDGSTAKTSGDQVTEVPEGSAQTGGA